MRRQTQGGPTDYPSSMTTLARLHALAREVDLGRFVQAALPLLAEAPHAASTYSCSVPGSLALVGTVASLLERSRIERSLQVALSRLCRGELSAHSVKGLLSHLGQSKASVERHWKGSSVRVRLSDVIRALLLVRFLVISGGTAARAAHLGVDLRTLRRTAKELLNVSLYRLEKEPSLVVLWFQANISEGS